MTFRDGLNDDDRYTAPFYNVAGEYISSLKENIAQLERIVPALNEEQAAIAERLISENEDHIEILKNATFEDGRVKEIDIGELEQIFKDEREFNSTREQELKDAGIEFPEEPEEKSTRPRNEKWSF